MDRPFDKYLLGYFIRRRVFQWIIPLRVSFEMHGWKDSREIKVYQDNVIFKVWQSSRGISLSAAVMHLQDFTREYFV